MRNRKRIIKEMVGDGGCAGGMDCEAIVCVAVSTLGKYMALEVAARVEGIIF